MLSRLFKRTALPLLLAGSLGASSPEPVNPDPDFADILQELPRATPHNFEAHSTDLKHLNMTGSPEPATFSDDYPDDLKSLRRTCPGIQENTDLIDWVNNIPAEELENAPRDFLALTYLALGGTANRAGKTEAVTMLSMNLSESDTLLDYLDAKRVELAERLQNDPLVADASIRWNNESPEYKQRILNHISRLTLDILMPGHEIDYPRVILLREKYKSIGDNTFGSYRSYYNEIYINGTLNPIKWTFSTASEVTVHESFHAFENMLVGWGKYNHLKKFPELEQQARIYRLSADSDRSLIRPDEDPAGYRVNFMERGSWAFQLAANAGKLQHQLQGNFRSDLFIDRGFNGRAEILAPPPNPSEPGILPAACHL